MKAKTARRTKAKPKARRATPLAEGVTHRGQLEAVRVLCRLYRARRLVPTAAQALALAACIGEAKVALEQLAALGDEEVARAVTEALRDATFQLDAAEI